LAEQDSSIWPVRVKRDGLALQARAAGVAFKEVDKD
jgi:hypothetical protein